MLFVHALFELLIDQDANGCQNMNIKQAIAEKMIITFVPAAVPVFARCAKCVVFESTLVKAGMQKLSRNIQHRCAYLRLAAKGVYLFIGSKR